MLSSQIANYVGNGSFESMITCSAAITNANYWNALDSIKGGFSFLASRCSNSVPYYGTGYQLPRTGDNFILSGFFCVPPGCSPEINRGYLRNRLKHNLQNGKTYCVKFYVNIANPSTYGMDGFGAWFGEANSLDTIKKFAMPLTFLTPQVQNPAHHIITDTLGWTLVTGTFVATGNEKFMIIGNFKADSATNKVLIDSTYLPTIATDVCIDDASCIDIDLPAFAGPDISCIPGDSVYIGRPQDVGIDEDCMWYKLPGIITPTTPALDTAAGTWVSPIATTTYVVRQEICGHIKWDTVIVYKDGVGLEKLKLINANFILSPNPAKDIVQIQFSLETGTDFTQLSVYNSLGQLIRREELIYKDKFVLVNTKEFENGVYTLTLTNNENERVVKKLVVEK